MARGNDIIVSSNPRGRFVEGKLKTGITPKPGTIMQLEAATAIDANGRFTFELAAPDADGGRPKGPLLILDYDWGTGKLPTDAYADSASVRCYVPIPGEEFNLLLQDVSGTADDHAISEMLIVDTGTGLLIATTGSPETEPFQLLETITDPTADTLAHVIYTGY
jgi:hypothetical protein